FLGTAVQHLRYSDTSIYFEYRKWLESVLHLNTWDPGYFCTAVAQLAGTFQSVSDTNESLYWKYLDRNLAITQWLWENDGQCDTDGLKAGYNQTRAVMREQWSNDTTVPMDTTLPSMHDLGLDTVLAKHFLYLSIKPQVGGRSASN